MANFKDDTEQVKREYEGLSNSTQIFIWALVGLGVVLGLLLGSALGYGVAVEEHEGNENCIEYQDEWYCAGGDEAQQAEAEEPADE
jgi:hypothetical protein